MTLTDSAVNPITVISKDTKEKLTNYKPYVDSKATVVEETVDPNLAASFKGDFYGLLQNLRVPSNMFYLTLLLNGIRSSHMFTGDKSTILLYRELEGQDVINIL